MKRLLNTLLLTLLFPIVTVAQDKVKDEKKSILISRVYKDSNNVVCDSLNAETSESTYANEFPKGGLVIKELVNQHIISEVNYSNLNDKVREGEAKYYNQNDQNLTVYHYVNNILKGDYFEYFENKTVYISGKYLNGKLNDTLKSYYPNHQLRRMDIYKNGAFISGKCFSSTGADTTYFPFEMEAEFIAEDGNIKLWVSKNLHYPASAIEEGTQGTVYVTFIVEKDGAVTFYKILRGASPELDKEVIRLIEHMPNWKPGEKDGYKQKSYMHIPIHFNLN